MIGPKKMITKIKSWYLNKKIQLKKWAKSKIKQFMKSRFLLGSLMLIVGISYTVVCYELSKINIKGEKFVYVNDVDAMGFSVAHASEQEQLSEGEADTVPNTPPIVQTIKKISAEYGIDWKMVYAVCLKESGCNPNIDCSNQYGKCDGGKSFGAYQIYNPTLDPERKRMAENFEEATHWTIKHGLRFKDNPSMFFKNHNGIAKTTNQWYVDGANEIYKTL